MRVAVVGLGGVGGYICASLAKSACVVVGFARGKHLKKIQENGLEIVEDSSSWNMQIDAKELDDSSGYFDLVLFCVKSYDLRDAYEKISSNIDSKSVILSFSNGVNNGDILRELSDSIVLDGCVYILSHVEESGVIRKKGKVFATVFGGEEKATQKLSQIFEDSNLRYKTPSDIKSAIWKKYIFISAFATITSYYDKSIGFIYENHKDEVKTLLEEIADVAQAKGIEIFGEVEKSLQTASKVPYDSSTSMHLDFLHHKRVELDGLSKYVIDEGEKYGVETPLMQKMYKSLDSKRLNF
ncbi:MAG: 2-dehydropantoate 2-reductase [Campylobacterota bacterium]|nr:2-dehydropantoate 2-reductase [Campylobacterota bacterium]